MAPGVLGIGTTAYISAHNQVNHTQVATLGVYSKLLLDSRPCKSLPHLSKRFQPGARWQVSFRNSENVQLEFQGWCHPEHPLGRARGPKRPNSSGGDSSGFSV